MRIGILGDVHGNLEALQAATRELDQRNVDHLVQVGDIVGYGSQPSECLRMIRDLGCTVCLGNHDAAVVGLLSTEYFNPYARQAVEWTRTKLETEEMDFLRKLPLVVEKELYTVVHGTLHVPDQFGYVMNVVDALESLQVQNTPVCFVGHSHVPAIYWLETEASENVNGKFEAEMCEQTGSYAKVLMNVGSVGQPRDEDPRAAYAIYDTESGEARIERVSYDIALTQRKILDAGLPEVLASRLALGV